MTLAEMREELERLQDRVDVYPTGLAIKLRDAWARAVEAEEKKRR